MADKSNQSVPANLYQEYVPPLFNAAVPENVPEYHGEAAVDIVAVHGLASKYPRAWSIKRSDGSRYYWLREKLPHDLPDARILGFEYTSEWYGDPAHTSLRECGAQLLRCLVRDRCHVGMPTMCPTRRKRPIIFIGHSFGGLVIKQALILAGQTLSTNASRTEYENHRDILSAIAGIIFLGTPHRGSAFSVWAQVKMAWGSFTGVATHKELVSILKVDSAMVTYLQDEFNLLYFDSRLSGLKLVCYWEEKELLLHPHIVVDRDSACLDYAACRGMDANHMDMNKFRDGPERDNNYDHVLADIRMIYQASAQTTRKRFETWRYGSSAPDFDRERLSLWLGPSRDPQKTQLLNKLETQKSVPYTCQWIHNLPQFLAWTASPPSSNMLWVNGKTGSGKSVLAAYLVELLAAGGAAGAYCNSNNIPVLCTNSCGQLECCYKRHTATVLFFFCGVDRANETPEKLVGTLIHQLLLSHDDSEVLFSMAFKLREKQRDGADVPSLSRLLLKMASVVGPVFIIIDGLEENPQLMACVKALSRLRSSTMVRILFLSQETMEVSKALNDHFGDQEPVLITAHTKSDINRFAAEKTAELIERKHYLKIKEAFIVSSLQNGAQGMFQWVNSALEYLKDEVDDPEEVKQRLEDLPSDLIATYDKTFERLARQQNDHRDKRIRIALQFLAVSGTTVSPLDLRAVVLIHERQEDFVKSLLDRNKAQPNVDTAVSELRKLLGSLVDFPSRETVRLAHPSLQTALTRLGPGGSPEGVTAKYKFTVKEAHYQVLTICMLLCGKSTLVHANAFAQIRVPLVEYAWSYWAYHFYHSGYMFGDQSPKLQTVFNEMVNGASGVALAYLEALAVFLSRPLKAVPGRFTDREYALSLKRAQECLIQPTKDLCNLRKNTSLALHLQDARNSVEAASATNSVYEEQHTQGWRKATSTETSLSLKEKFFGCQTEIQRLKLDEYSERLPWLLRPSGPTKLVLDIARNMRLVALRFAVDPVYSSLILTADGLSFSPLHPLLYLAQLFEDCGTYPYWKVLPPTSDLLDNFMCAEDDLEYASAKFVLHCFEWRDLKKQADHASDVGHYVRLPGVLLLGPRPSGHQLTRISTENREQVRRLYQMPSDRYFVAGYAYATFRSTDELVRKYIINPLAHVHMRTSLMAEEDQDVLPITDPDVAMSLVAPNAVRESPLREYIRAVPQIIGVWFVWYVIALLEVFGRLSRQVLAVHFARLEVAVVELNAALTFFARFGRSDGDMPRLRGWYLIPGLILFSLRCRYLPLFGAYYMPHSWKEFPYAYKHPAAYLDLQNVAGFLIWLTTILRVMLYNVIGLAAVGVSLDPTMANTGVAHIANTYGVFYYLCTLERSLFAMLTVAATVVACSLIMMHDAKTLSEVWEFSIFWWFNTFFALFASAANNGAIQAGGGLGAVLVLSLVQLSLLVLFVYYCDAIVRFISYFLIPITAPAMFLWRTVLHNHAAIMKACGSLLLLYMVLRAFKLTHKFIWDPYDFKGSHSRLFEVSKLARSSLQPGEVLRVGWYPLGEAVREQSQNLQHSTPNSAVQSGFGVNIQQELGSRIVQAVRAMQESSNNQEMSERRFDKQE